MWLEWSKILYYTQTLAMVIKIFQPNDSVMLKIDIDISQKSHRALRPQCCHETLILQKIYDHLLETMRGEQMYI